MPSAGVHSMAHGAAAAGGSTYYADLVADSLAASGLRARAGHGGLDFGCSSGRVVRVLAAAFPELDWHGCDPIPDAIEWARANLPGVALRAQPRVPAAARTTTGSSTLAFAISIWSHFARGRGARLAARDAPHDPARRAPVDHHARRADDRATPGARACARSSSSRRCARARTSTASGTPPSSARWATTAWRTPTGARPSCRAEWLLAQAHAGLARALLPARPRRGEPGPVRARARLGGRAPSRS